MRLKSKLSPYPILDNFGDDYIDSSFVVEYNVQTQFSEVTGTVKFNLKCESILSLIKNKQAQYVVHIECPSTCYRTTCVTDEDCLDFKLNAKMIAKLIEIRAFVVLTKDVVGYTSDKFHPDYANQSYDLLSHSIVAIGTAMDFDISNDDRDLESLPSVIQIVKLSSNKKGSMTVNTDDDDHILVGLAESVFDTYANLGKTVFKSTSFSLVLLPALIIVIQRMYAGRDDVQMTSRHWFVVVNSILEKNGYKLDNLSIDNDTLLAVCQAVFADPIARSFGELDSYSEEV